MACLLGSSLDLCVCVCQYIQWGFSFLQLATVHYRNEDTFGTALCVCVLSRNSWTFAAHRTFIIDKSPPIPSLFFFILGHSVFVWVVCSSLVPARKTVTKMAEYICLFVLFFYIFQILYFVTLKSYFRSFFFIFFYEHAAAIQMQKTYRRQAMLPNGRG